MNKVAMRGSAASVMWSYHRAADLVSWTLVGDTLTAQVRTHDVFRLSQQPLTFVVPVNGGSWRWAISTLQVSGTSLTATLGEKEV